MLQIVKIDENNYNSAYNFLKTVPSISAIDDAILKNGVIILDDERVIGSISFEIYDHIGLIRYFVFKKNLSRPLLKNLMEQLEENARSIDLYKIACVADNNQIEELFKELGFLKLEKKIYINEDIITESNFSSSNFLYKEV
ncbi:MAG: GNAT family N-acetyltransferase [Erysipelotrichaceae bacterium]|nr:GNAT family N-acetyltransferase [Erysipelotrichaceae bacterium]